MIEPNIAAIVEKMKCFVEATIDVRIDFAVSGFLTIYDCESRFRRSCLFILRKKCEVTEIKVLRFDKNFPSSFFLYLLRLCNSPQLMSRVNKTISNNWLADTIVGSTKISLNNIESWWIILQITDRLNVFRRRGKTRRPWLNTVSFSSHAESLLSIT